MANAKKPPPDRNASLTDKQRAFAEEYMLDLNMTKAAERAGYKKGSARCIGQKTFANPLVQAEIQKNMAARSGRTNVSADLVLREIGAIAFTTISDVLEWDEDGKILLKPSQDLSDGALSAIKRVTKNKGEIRVELHSKEAALNLLMRHLGLLNDKVEVTVSEGHAEQLKSAWKKAEESG